MFSFFNNPAKDAKRIHNAIDYRVVRAAWDGYVRLKKKDFQQTHGSATPAWFALFSIQNYKGNFKRFSKDELHLLQSFTMVHEAYEEIVNELSSHSNDKHFASQLLETHPNLHDALPDAYNNIDNVGAYLVRVIKQYQLMLEEFYAKYKQLIDDTIERLQSDESVEVVTENEEEFADIEETR